jgi:signal peptidase
MMDSRVTENTIFVLVAILLAFGFYQTLGGALNTPVPVVSVVSESMEPTFYKGDMILVQGQSFEDIQEGDIIIFQSQYIAMPIIHRVIEKNETALQTKGDNNNAQLRICLGPDGPSTPSARECNENERPITIEKGITEDQILGKKIFIIPKIGYAKLFLSCTLRAGLPTESQPHFCR